MEFNFTNNTIYDGIMNGATVTDNHQKDINASFVDCLDEVIRSSSKEEEKNCAIKAKELYVNDRKSLKSYIIDNLSTFTTGTFATVSGGLLLSVIKGILKMA